MINDDQIMTITKNDDQIKNGDYQIMDPASKSLDQDRNGDDHSEMVMTKAMLASIRTWITKRESVTITEKSDSDDQKSIVMIKNR